LVFLKRNVFVKITFESTVGRSQCLGSKRKSRVDIAVDILRVAMNGAKKTHIVYEVNLNFNIAQKYLEMLYEK
jgi:predicted transcriptional regulator